MVNIENNEQWKLADGGDCTKCRRQSYCKKGCAVHKNKEKKRKIKEKIEMALSTGLSPEQIGVTEQMMKEYGVEVPKMPEPGGSEI